MLSLHPGQTLWALVSEAPRKALAHLVFTEPDQGQSPAPGAGDDTFSSWSCCFRWEETDDKPRSPVMSFPAEGIQQDKGTGRMVRLPFHL